jgi:hypothetical protein
VRLSAYKPSLGVFFPSPSVDLRPDVMVMTTVEPVVIIAVVCASMAMSLITTYIAASHGLG